MLDDTIPHLVRNHSLKDKADQRGNAEKKQRTCTQRSQEHDTGVSVMSQFQEPEELQGQTQEWLCDHQK